MLKAFSVVYLTIVILLLQKIYHTALVGEFRWFFLENIWQVNGLMHSGIVSISDRNYDFVEYFSNLTTFPFSCITFYYNILLKNAQKNRCQNISGTEDQFLAFLFEKSLLQKGSDFEFC